METVRFLAGVAVGAIGTVVVYSLLPAAGTLRIDHSNPEKDVYRLEIDKLETLPRRSRLVLKIDNNASLSQE